MRVAGIVRSPGWARRLACAAVGVELVHIALVLFLRNSIVLVSCLQIFLPVLAAVACLRNRHVSQSSRDRRAWVLLASAFALWTVAQVCYYVELYFLPPDSVFRSVDDVLWLFFAVPLLLVLSGSLEGNLNWVSWMDQVQAFLFYSVVMVMVYSRPSILTFDKAYSVQNVALLLSCVLRYSAAATDHERRFFGRLGAYLLTYSICSAVGGALAHRGWAPGSMVDLFWTAPLTLFCVLTFLGEADHHLSSRKKLRLQDEFSRYLHDLSALGLAVLSMGASIYLTLHWTLRGSVCLMCSFALFAARTCGRERELHRANERLQESVLQDALTGLGNRACLRQHLGHLLTGAAKSHHHAVAALFVDLDRFKSINDSLGHEVGDKVITEVASRIKASCQSGSVVCRLGGDEFVVVLEGDLAHSAEHAATKILNEIRAPLWLDSKMLQLSGSIGVAITRGDDEPDTLLRKADYAMYRAKRLGKNRVEVSDAAMHANAHAGYMLEAELRDCLEREQIGIYLQPIYSLEKNDVCGFEALARWSHPQLGMIPPSEFIPLAEETGMILELGRQVLARACRAVTLWNKTWNTHLWVSVNVSARQFSDADLISSLLQTLASTEMDPNLLHLEITESVLLVGEDAVAKVLLEAQRCGMEISLDDFGTGYSSLSHLLSFPTDEVKIDCSFVRGLHQDVRRAELVRTVLQLGRSLHKRVIAEGVETDEELQALQEMGCKYAQGELFAKSFPVENLAALAPFAVTNMPTGVGRRKYGVV